jgi:hypothetical protein
VKNTRLLVGISSTIHKDGRCSRLKFSFAKQSEICLKGYPSMLKKSFKKWPRFITIFLVLGIFLMDPSMIGAQTRTHLVVRGDTLWDICEKYYGDPDLWPKLWEMNPFVTNPHLLSPGDVIALFEGVPYKKSMEQEYQKLAGQEGKQTPGKGDQDLAAKKDQDLSGQKDKTTDGESDVPLALLNGIDVTKFINVKTLGYLSRRKVKPLGRIFSSDGEKEMLYEGDTAFVIFDDKIEISPGDEFTVATSTKLISLPNTGSRRGYAVSFVGQIVVEKPGIINRRTGQFDTSKQIFQTTVTESFRTVHVGDLVIPFKPVSSCIEPTPVEEQFTDTIHAAKDDLKILGETSVVYFDRGTKQGIRKGNLFELVRTKRVPRPWLGDKSYTSTRMLPRSKIMLPDMSIGIVLIVDARLDTSTGLVVSANEEFYPGAPIKAGFTQLESTEYLSKIPACSKE